MSLRALLVIIGVCIIAGIYLWEVLRKKRSGKRPTEVVFDHDLMTDQGTDSGPGSDETDIYALDSPRLRNSVKHGPEDVSGISISARDSNAASAEDEQIPLILHDVIEPDDKPVAVRDSDQDAGSPATITEEQLLVLVIAPDAQEFFNGLDILTATKAAGMKFGNMNIFHHYGPVDRKLPVPLFSLANLYEPGEFDLKSMDNFSTRGLIIYMCLPAPIDAEQALEIMLDAAHVIADKLAGRVCDRNRNPLSDQELENMRDRSRRYQKQST